MFVPTFNANLGAKLGVAVTPRQTTYINMITVWISFPVCAYTSNANNNYIPAAISWGIAIINGVVGHLLPLLENKYMPGAFQSMFMVPLGFWVLYSIHFRFGWMDGLILPLIVGCLFHIVGLIFPAIFFP